MVATYQRHLTGTQVGKAQKRLTSHVWGPDLASRLEARRDWQAAGGVGGLLMTLYPVTQSGSSPTYEAWLASQGVYPGTQIGYYDFNQGMWVQYTGEYTEPFYDENNNWISEGAGFYTPYGFLVDYDGMLEAYGYDYASYAQAVGNHLIHVPVMDHLGNVTSVVRLSATPGVGSASQTEFLYDYDAFGKEIRSTALLPGSNPDNYPLHYSTKYTDAETGLVYYGYRFYDPANGRWINRDPIEERGGLNLYAAMLNSSPNLVDADGRIFYPVLVGIGIVTTALGLYKAWDSAKDVSEREYPDPSGIVDDIVNNEAGDPIADFVDKVNDYAQETKEDVADVAEGIPTTSLTGEMTGYPDPPGLSQVQDIAEAIGDARKCCSQAKFFEAANGFKKLKENMTQQGYKWIGSSSKNMGGSSEPRLTTRLACRAQSELTIHWRNTLENSRNAKNKN
jgi:RHS repeat-associated protein